MSIIPFYDMNRAFRQMEKQLLRPDEFLSPYPMVPREVMNEFFGPWHDAFKPMAHLASTMNRLALNAMQDLPTSITSKDDKFQINVDVQHFAPEEICVTVEDGSVLVRGKHEEKRDGHGFISREFVRRYALPENCLPDTVQSSLSSDGVLTVTAPRVLPLPSPGERIVPITHTGPIKKQIATDDDAVKKIENEK